MGGGVEGEIARRTENAQGAATGLPATAVTLSHRDATSHLGRRTARTGSRTSHLRRGLADRLRELAPTGITAAIDLHSTDTTAVACELGVPASRMTTIVAVVDGVTPANVANAAPAAIEQIARLAAEGHHRAPIAATFPVDEVRAHVTLQAGRHVHGKDVIDLKRSAT